MSQHAHSCPRRFAAVALAALLTVSVLPLPALAVRLSSDRVGAATVGSLHGLRSVAPDIVAPAGILVTSDRRVLWSRAADSRRAMASTTKIMTALVVLDRARLSDLVTVSPAATDVGESSAGLVTGERLSVGQLLEAMLVKSANDAAVSLAEHTGGSVPRFVAMMNAKAVELGLKDTHFTDPHGLDQPGHYTSAADLATLARVAMGRSEFRRIVGSKAIVIPGPNGRSRTLDNSNELLGRYPGAEGVKTGWTDRAGYCLVAAAKRGPVELYAVVLGTSSAEARFQQASRLLDWGFTHYRETVLASAGETLGTVPVSDYLDTAVVAEVAAATATLVFDASGPVRRYVALRPSVAAPVSRGDALGTLVVRQGASTLATVTLVAAGDVRAPGFWERARIFAVRTWRSVFGGPKTAVGTVRKVR